MSAKELMDMKLAEPRYAVPGLIVEGLNLLVGNPKIGKSWLALNLCLAVATGGIALGNIPVEKGAALYLALEDNRRRLQVRLHMVLHNSPAPADLYFQTTWPRIGEGGIEELERIIDENPSLRLIVIDTFKKIRPLQGRGRNAYDEDYEATEPLQRLAGERGVPIIVVHHERKAAADDFLETVSGSYGLTGAADSILVLRRDRGQRAAKLLVTGRDIEEREVPLRFDAKTGSWIRTDGLSNERREIIELLTVEPGLTPTRVSERLGKKLPATKKLMAAMAHYGQVEVRNGGHYHPTTDDQTEAVA